MITRATSSFFFAARAPSMDRFASSIASVVTESETSTRKTVQTLSARSVFATRPRASASVATNATRSPSEISCCCHGRSASERGRMKRRRGATRKIPRSFGDRSTYVAPPRAHESVESGELQTNRRYTTKSTSMRTTPRPTQNQRLVRGLIP